MHLCISKLAIIGSDNGLSSRQHQAIIRTNGEILSIGTLGTNFSEILMEIHTFIQDRAFEKTSSGKWQSFCLSLSVLILIQILSIDTP